MKKIVINILILAGSCQYPAAQSIEDLIKTISSTKQKADTLQYFGRKYHMKAMPDSAGYCFNLGLGFAKQIKNNNNQIVQLYSLLSKVSQMQRQPEKALAVIQQAKPYIDSAIPKPTLENYLYFTATYFRLLLKYDSSLYYFQQTEILNNTYNPYGNWYVYDGMAEIFIAESNYNKAEEYYLKAYDLTKSKGVRMDHGLMINRLGNLYSQQNNPEKFAAILQEHAQFIKSGKKDYRRDPIHSLLYINWGNITVPQKIDFLRSVKQVHTSNGYLQAASLANYHIASIYESIDQPEEALKYLYENRDFYIVKNIPTDSYKNLQYIYKLQTKAGKTLEALETANQLLETNLRLADYENRELSMELEKKYETEKKEKEISLLNAQNDLKSLELIREAEQKQALKKQNLLKDTAIMQQQQLTESAEREKNLKYNELEKERLLSKTLYRENELKQQLLADHKKKNLLLWFGISLLAVAGAVILFQYRHQLKKNKIIERQREDLEILNREIHHRVKNNLQVISSLLDLQSAASDDIKTAEKFQDGSRRVQNMAYIHQNLYHGEVIDRIDMQLYIQMLTSNLMQSYNADKITLTADVEAIKLHSDTVIPLGMIINELVSNSLKYAFKNKENGQIQVVLKQIDEKLLLQVKDNGIGIPENVDLTAGSAFGYKIIKAFTQKLKAMMTINNKNGTDVQLLISKYRIA